MNYWNGAVIDRIGPTEEERSTRNPAAVKGVRPARVFTSD
jgi:hypothetical protein